MKLGLAFWKATAKINSDFLNFVRIANSNLNPNLNASPNSSPNSNSNPNSNPNSNLHPNSNPNPKKIALLIVALWIVYQKKNDAAKIDAWKDLTAIF